jgi:glutamate racemase
MRPRADRLLWNSVNTQMHKAPLGVFDSGVGGLSVLRSIVEEMPDASVIYVADQAHVPYGPRTLEQVRRFSEAISRFLLAKGARVVVVACNSASAAALADLRRMFPEVAFVGMEPAVKPAAEKTRSGIVGVLATPATFQGALYASVVERFAADVELLRSTCPGLVEQIELGNLDGPATRGILSKALRPMLAQGIDTVVLACTHFPFVIPIIEEIVGGNVRVIDPAPAVARQALRKLRGDATRRQSARAGEMQFFTSGDPKAFAIMLQKLLGFPGDVAGLRWLSDHEVVEGTGSLTASGTKVRPASGR